MTEWKKYKLGEIAELVKDTIIPNENECLNYIGLEHIDQQSLSLNSIGKSTDVTSQKFLFEKGDILFGKLRPYFRKVYRPKFKGVCSTDIWVIRAKKNFEQGFLFYFFANEELVDKASGGSSGTRMPRADWNYLKNTEWFVPNFESQQKIGNILSALDDKIELNRQTNQTLEQIAQTLFKEWFVNFNFPGATGEMQDSELGMIPKGWRVGCIGDIYKTTSGGTPSRNKPEYYENGIIDWIKSKELNNSFIIETEEKINELGLKNSSAKLLPEHSVLIAMYGATVGQIAITIRKTTCNQAICAILPNENYPFTFIFLVLKNNFDEIKQNAVGSAQQNISQQVILNFKIIIPPIEIVKQYHKIAEPIFEKIKENEIETRTLTQIRDTLLPRLMSGELEV